MTVQEALRQINKLCAIESDVARLIYFQNILKQAATTERAACVDIVKNAAILLADWERTKRAILFEILARGEA